MEPVQESRQLDDLSDASAPAGSWDSDSPSSSRSVSTVSYEYNPDDFPRLNEIEEFQSPSFVWPPSPSVSGRHNLLGRSTSIQGSKKMPKKLAAKLQTEMDYLAILLSLSDIVPAAASFAGDAESMEVIEGAQQTLHKASARAKALDLNKEDLDEIFRALQTSVTNISSVLEPTKVALAKPIQLAELVAKTAGEVPARYCWYRECQELKSKSERLTRLLRLAASIDLYEKPLPFIVVRVEGILFIASRMAEKHRNPGNIANLVLLNSTSAYTVKKVAVYSANTFKKIAVELHDCIVNISWLIRKCTSSSPLHADIHEDIVGRPPFAVDEPILYFIWEQIATLLNGSPQDKIDAAKSLASLAVKPRYGKMIIKEGGEEPLVKLGKEGEADAQEEAINVLGLLGRNLDNAMMLAKDGSNVFSVLASVLNDGPTKVQSCAAWAVSQLAAHYLPGSRFRHMTVVVEPLVKYLIDKKDNVSYGWYANSLYITERGVSIELIRALARLLARQGENVEPEVMTALTEISNGCYANCEVVNNAAGYITQLVYREHSNTQKWALLLACNIVTHGPYNKELNDVIVWANDNCSCLTESAAVRSALAEAAEFLPAIGMGA